MQQVQMQMHVQAVTHLIDSTGQHTVNQRADADASAGNDTSYCQDRTGQDTVTHCAADAGAGTGACAFSDTSY